MTDAPPIASPHDRRWGIAVHASALAGVLFGFTFANVIAPLVIWSLRRRHSAFVDDQGREAVNFQLTLSLVLVTCWITRFLVVTWFAYWVLAGIGFVFTAVAILSVRDGRGYRYPWSYRFLE